MNLKIKYCSMFQNVGIDKGDIPDLAKVCILSVSYRNNKL